jgi:hypothetical protein
LHYGFHRLSLNVVGSVQNDISGAETRINIVSPQLSSTPLPTFFLPSTCISLIELS